MKGFGIEIKNTLLDPKHVESMGMAIWLYLWLIDHMTSINEEGVGLVLGGRPVKSKEVCAELGMHPNTYTDWIKKLQAYPYIETTLTPYGYVFRVFKAHKRFGKRFTEKGETGSQFFVRGSQKPVNVIKTVQDNTTTPNVEYDVEEENFNPRKAARFTFVGKPVFALFADNPAHKLWRMRPIEREAADILMKEYGIEELERRYRVVQKYRGEEKCPVINKPSEFLEKMPNMEAFLKRL